MKKLSKVTMQMGETLGIDLGDKISRYCIVDHTGDVVEEGSFRNQASSLENHFGDRPRRIALEAGAQSAWISRELERLGHELVVANPRQLKRITASDTKNDPVDARKLALLARADLRLLAPVEHRSVEQQAELAVIRARDAMLPALARVGISPHTMRHTKAMHLLQSGVPLVKVKDFLGHLDLKSTEVYVQADLEMKRKALGSTNGPQATPAPTPQLSSNLIKWLEAL